MHEQIRNQLSVQIKMLEDLGASVLEQLAAAPCSLLEDDALMQVAIAAARDSTCTCALIVTQTSPCTHSVCVHVLISSYAKVAVLVLDRALQSPAGTHSQVMMRWQRTRVADRTDRLACGAPLAGTVGSEDERGRDCGSDWYCHTGRR
jgi:hypothetical protein